MNYLLWFSMSRISFMDGVSITLTTRLRSDNLAAESSSTIGSLISRWTSVVVCLVTCILTKADVVALTHPCFFR